jgi:hypothetical protein
MAGLCMVAALNVMSFAAASAQAEATSTWNINGTALSNNTLLPKVTATLENNHSVLLGHALGKELNILCTSIAFKEAVLKEKGGSLGKIRFAGCRITTNGGEVLPACEPKNGTEKGVVETALLKDLIVLESSGTAGEPYDRLEPEAGSRFVEIETSASCAFGEKIPIITELATVSGGAGGFVLKDCNNEAAVEKVTHLGEEGPGTKLWVISKTVEHESHIDGSINVILSGTHAGLKFSGEAG